MEEHPSDTREVDGSSPSVRSKEFLSLAIKTVSFIIIFVKLPESNRGMNMKVIIINGPMGVGKTTAGKAIAEKNPGTAFIDGDWCMDIHPFVGNPETRAMAVDNILHMIGNYQRCSECSMVVLAWLMDDPHVYRSMIDGLSALQTDVNSVTLVCSRECLAERWKKDHQCEWRTDQWFNASVASLTYFESAENVIDTTGLTVEQIVNRITE